MIVSVGSAARILLSRFRWEVGNLLKGGAEAWPTRAQRYAPEIRPFVTPAPGGGVCACVTPAAHAG